MLSAEAWTNLYGYGLFLIHFSAIFSSDHIYKNVQIWDLRTGGVFETIKYEHGVTALQFDSRKVICAGGENGVKVRPNWMND
jgi:hypothetical protein